MKNKRIDFFQWIPFVMLILSVMVMNLNISKENIILIFLSALFFYFIEHLFLLFVKIPVIRELYIVIHSFTMYKGKIFKRNIGLDFVDINTDNSDFINIKNFKKLKSKCLQIQKEYNRNLPTIFITKNKTDFFIPFYHLNPLGGIYISEQYLNKGFGNFILGHEISHFFNKDHLQRLDSLILLAIVSFFFSLYFSPYINIILLPILSLFFNMISKLYERKSELRADLFGKYLSSKNEALEFFNYLYFAEEYFCKISLFNTHPSLIDRKNNLLINNFNEKKVNSYREPEFNNLALDFISNLKN